MRHRAPRARRTALSVAVPVGLVTSLALTWGATHAAFSATTHNPGNSWQTGTVVLEDSDSDAALFTSEANGPDGLLKPGSSRSRCIRLHYEGSLQADIRMYVGTPDQAETPATALDRYLMMSIERVDVAPEVEVKADCTGIPATATATFLDSSTHTDAPTVETTRTLSHLRTTHADYEHGLVVSSATERGAYMTLRITYVLKDDNLAQDKSSTATFTWEARNT